MKNLKYDFKALKLQVYSIILLSTFICVFKVWYSVEGFLDKNRDTLRYDVMGLLISSKDKLISKMFLDLRNFQVSAFDYIEKKANIA